MAISINLYSFKKRENSTVRPSTAAKTYSGLVKEQTTIMAPTITFNLGSASPSAYNYAYIPTFSRYYFITDWSFSNGLWEAQMSVDVLATWKSDIGASKEYVIRSASSWNGDILDTLYPTTSGITRTPVLGISPLTFGGSSDCYVVGIINSDADAVGAVSYYAFTPTQFNVFKNYLMSDFAWLDIDFTNIEENSEQLVKTSFNPFQYVVSCMNFPIDLASGTLLSELKYGWWSLPTPAYRLPYKVASAYSLSLTFPRHPQSSRGNYVNISPYTRYSLEFKPFGTIPLDPNTFAEIDTLECDISVDCVTGVAILTIGSSINPIVTRRAQVGVQVQLAQIGRDYLGMASNAITTAGNTISSITNADVGGAITSAGTGIISAIETSMPQLSTNGSNGSYVEFNYNPVLTGEFFEIVDDDLVHRGRPLCQDVYINSLSGYTMVADADIKINGTQAENEQIKTYMEGGFYYE